MQARHKTQVTFAFAKAGRTISQERRGGGCVGLAVHFC